MSKTYCDVCGKETGYYVYKLKMNMPRYGHGTNWNKDICSDCGKAIEVVIANEMERLKTFYM